MSSTTNAEDAAAQHVRRTLHALELLAAGPRTQADVAQELAVHRRTARRLLARLVDEGYAEPSQRGRHVAYRATPRLAVLGRQVADSLDLVAIGRRHLVGLDPAQVGARFVALLGEEGVRLVHVEQPEQLDPADSGGIPTRTGPLHATAAGKVFLSADTALVGEVLNQERLAFTERTLVARADVLLELATVRGQGYAVEDQEHQLGMRTVAGPVENHVGRIVAALGAVPLPGATLEQVGDAVRDAALACSREIGAAV